jgi:hypothetical protein
MQFKATGLGVELLHIKAKHGLQVEMSLRDEDRASFPLYPSDPGFAPSRQQAYFERM